MASFDLHPHPLVKFHLVAAKSKSVCAENGRRLQIGMGKVDINHMMNQYFEDVHKVAAFANGTSLLFIRKSCNLPNKSIFSSDKFRNLVADFEFKHSFSLTVRNHVIKRFLLCAVFFLYSKRKILVSPSVSFRLFSISSFIIRRKEE